MGEWRVQVGARGAHNEVIRCHSVVRYLCRAVLAVHGRDAVDQRVVVQLRPRRHRGARGAPHVGGEPLLRAAATPRQCRRRR